MFYFYFIISYTLFINAIPVGAGDYCPYYSSSYYRYRYCDYGCCGSKDSSYSSVCCSVNAGIIAGAVIGSVVGLAILIGIIVYCCVAANNAKRRTGTVIQPTNTTATHNVVVNTTTVTQGPSTIPGLYGPVNYGYPGSAPPPAYYPYNNVPQGGTDPAYPPPAAKY